MSPGARFALKTLSEPHIWALFLFFPNVFPPLPGGRQAQLRTDLSIKAAVAGDQTRLQVVE